MKVNLPSGSSILKSDVVVRHPIDWLQDLFNESFSFHVEEVADYIAVLLHNPSPSNQIIHYICVISILLEEGL